MKVLIADDAEVVRLMLGRFVESLGYQLILACDGVEAVERCARDLPDMVLMDMLMPRLDGAEAGRRIKAASAERWIPIILITAVEEVAKLADAMEIGADDYLLKPVNFRILEAKIKAIERTVELNRKVREQALALAEYYDRAEEEKRVARHLMEQLVNRESLSDPQLHSWIAPAESLSGDLVAAARTPGGVLHLLLADGIGHGLTAALNVLPLTQPFYAMTERGFALSDILLEMHRKVRQVLPAGRFVALAFVAVDFARRQLEVWNGGIPDLRLFGPAGQLLARWPSRNLPLGILSEAAFSTASERYAYAERCNLVLCSDGLLEARDRSGEVFGAARLALACAGVAPAQALRRTVESLSVFMNGERCHDDVSLAIVDLDPTVALALPVVPARQDWPAAAELQWHYALSLGPAELRSLHVVPHIMGFLAQLPPLRGGRSAVFLVLTELFVNALDHGLLGMPVALRRNGMEAYLRERSLRISHLRSGRIDIELSGYTAAGVDLLKMRVADSGDGFDFAAYQAAPHGRGIALLQALCADVRYLNGGSQVEVCYVAEPLNESS